MTDFQGLGVRESKKAVAGVMAPGSYRARRPRSAWPGAPRPELLSCHGIRQTLEGSFSAVSKPNFASKYAFESSRRDLHNALYVCQLCFLHVLSPTNFDTMSSLSR